MNEFEKTKVVFPDGNVKIIDDKYYGVSHFVKHHGSDCLIDGWYVIYSMFENGKCLAEHELFFEGGFLKIWGLFSVGPFYFERLEHDPLIKWETKEEAERRFKLRSFE